MKPMNKWDVYKDEDVYVVLHYVGGEDRDYVYGYYDNESAAQEKVAELNASGAKYRFTCYEGECTLITEGLPEEEPSRAQAYCSAVDNYFGDQ